MRLKAESRPHPIFVTGSFNFPKEKGLAPRYVDYSPGQLLRRVNLERCLPRAFGDLMTRYDIESRLGVHNTGLGWYLCLKGMDCSYEQPVLRRRPSQERAVRSTLLLGRTFPGA